MADTPKYSDIARYQGEHSHLRALRTLLVAWHMYSTSRSAPAIARRANSMHCNRVHARPMARVAINSNNFMQRVISRVCVCVWHIEQILAYRRAGRAGRRCPPTQRPAKNRQCPSKSACFFPVSSSIAVIEASRFL